MSGQRSSDETGQAWRYDQTALVWWAGRVPVRQKYGEGPLRLASDVDWRPAQVSMLFEGLTDTVWAHNSIAAVRLIRGNLGPE